MRYSPRVDLVFKKLFGSEENKALLLSLTNAVLGDAYNIKELTLLNPYQPGAYLGDRMSILDIKAKDDSGCHYNIEMQLTDQVFYTKRALYYWSKLYAEQIKAGDGYDQLNKTISIHVLNFNHFDTEPNYHNIFHVLNAKSRTRAFEDFEMHFIELQKFAEFPEKERVLSALDRWTAFLSQQSDFNCKHIPTVLQQDPDIVRAIEVLDTMFMDEKEREIYEGQMKWLRDESGSLKTAELKGVEKGFEQGKVEGRQEGLEQGLEQGEQVGIKKVAAALLAGGQPPSLVAQSTGLPLTTVNALLTALTVQNH